MMPSIRLSCLPNVTFEGTFEIRSDNDWLASFEVGHDDTVVSGSNCRMEYALNGQDFFSIDQVHEPCNFQKTLYAVLLHHSVE